MDKATKQTILGVSILVIVAGVMVFMVAFGRGGPSQTGAMLLSDVSASDHTKGNPAATVTLVEYSDFQCPACGSYYPMIKQLVAELGEQINFAYRHFPLPQHDNAVPAAAAAEAAGRQGKFWEMHDQLFENQNAWAEKSESMATSLFESYATTIGLDIEQYRADVTLAEIEDKIEGDRQSGIRSGVNSTPTFFLNGQKIQSPRSYEEFKNLITTAPN